MIANIRYALRTLSKSPGFTIVSLLTLALGIGVNSSMFSLMNTLLLASAPFPRPETIITLSGQTPKAESLRFSPIEIDELRNHPSNAFTAIAPSTRTMETVSLPDQLPEQVQGTEAKADLFKVLETPPLLGRFFTADECVAGRDTVVLITEEMWRKKFTANPDVLGQTLRISGRMFTIIGVLPKAYSAPSVFGEGQYFRPLVFSKEVQENRERRRAGLFLRLAPGVTLPQALASLAPVAERWGKENPRLYPNYHFRVQLAGRVGGSANVAIMALLLGLAAAILALACANLANLQMARAASRLRDLAIRSALGATRWILIKQQLVESMVLSLAGGAFSLLIASWCNEIIGRNTRMGLSSTLEMPIDGRVLAFTAGVSILAGLGFGLVPAWIASGNHANEALKQQSRGSTSSKNQGWIRSLLVVGQVALSLTLLSVAGMMIYGLHHTLNSRPSWDTESILTANVQLDERVYDSLEKRRSFHDALSARLATIPGIQSSTIASRLPIAGGGSENDVLIEGQDIAGTSFPKSKSFLVTPGFFKTLGIRLLDGRTFPDNISFTSPEQTVVNESLAKHFWPTGSAIGQRLGVKGGDGKVTWREIIGVVADAEDPIAFTEPTTHFQYYTTMTHNPWAYFQIAVRGPNPGHFANDLRQAVADISPDVSARFVWTVQDMRDQFLHNLVVINGVLLAFALLGLALASIGLYGIVSNNVSQRSSEFGIRLALGAHPSGVMRLVLHQSVLLTVIGLVLGAIGSYVLGLALRPSLGLIIGRNNSILIGTSVVILAVTVLATWFPARRATSINPLEALRAE